MKCDIHMIEPTTIVSEYHSIVSGLKTAIMRLIVSDHGIIMKQNYIRYIRY